MSTSPERSAGAVPSGAWPRNVVVFGASGFIGRNLLERLKGRVTLILVTPRPSLLSLADRVFEIRDGTMSERGQERSRLATPATPAVDARKGGP